MTKYLTLSLFAAMFATLLTLPARAADDKKPALSLVDELARHRYEFSVANGELEGPGGRFLTDEARTAQFVLVGEDHGIGSIPEFVGALYRAAAPLGFRHLAVEVGPLSGAAIERMARSSDPERAFADFNREHPFSLPFFSWQEECRLAATAVRLAPSSRPAIWALDQEFVLSSAIHFKRLVELAPNREARAVATEFLHRVEGEFGRIVEKHDPGGVFLVQAKAEDFDRLDKAFGASPGSEAGRILHELRVSWEIYLKNSDGRGYESNLQRSLLMKEHFMNYYREALRVEKTPPRVLFKFGAFHMKRGRSVTNVFDIGNLASELATSNGSHSFHILVIAATGTQNAYFPFLGNVADKQKPIDAVGSFDFMDIKPLVEAAGPQGWSVIDLRPLRKLVSGRKFGTMDRGLEDAIFGYDAVVVIRDAHAATLFE